MIITSNLGRLAKPQSLLIAFFLCLIVFQIVQHRSPDTGSGTTAVDTRPHVGGTADVQNATLGFEKIYVINRAARTDRRDSLTLAGAFTGLDLTFIDGVDGANVEDRVLPADSREHNISPGNKGSWRAHMNALRSVIEANLTSALILEDDVDWDIRLKEQLRRFAHASRLFLAPGSTKTLSDDETAISVWELNRRVRLKPTITPFGDNWDVLWLGHCGTELPLPFNSSASGDSVSLLRITIPNDASVPQPAQLRPHPFANQDPIGEVFPPHTRVVHASSGTVCSTGYAVSQAGARKLLHKFGLQTLTTGWDLMLRDWCDGVYHRTDEDDQKSHNLKTRRPTCLTVQPPLFGHWLETKDGASDIGQQGGGYLKKAGSQYIRLSVKANLEALAHGVEMHELVDQWPDSHEVAENDGGR